MIHVIIKTIILYFIRITHTDDFPSTGTRLVFLIQSVTLPVHIMGRLVVLHPL